jgi:hypothetical protein
LSDQNSAQEDGSDEAQRSQCAIEMPKHRRYSDQQIQFESENAALRVLFRKLKRMSDGRADERWMNGGAMRALSLAVDVEIPVAPADIGEAAEIRAERAAALSFVRRDAFLGLGDFARQHGDGLLSVGRLVVSPREARHLDRPQRFAVLPEPCPVPGNPAVAVGHARFL